MKPDLPESCCNCGWEPGFYRQTLLTALFEALLPANPSRISYDDNHKTVHPKLFDDASRLF